jgi:histidinol phosphatase-like enzyme
VFLHEDGVINSNKFNKRYIGLLKYFRWVPGAIKATKYLNKKNCKVVVVTNYSGVARVFNN